VCEPKNEQGLRIPFTYDDETGTVEAEFTLDDAFSGAPTYAHGGVTLAIMDEAMAWATIADSKAFAMTQTTTTTFLRPVKIGRTYRVRAKVESTNDEGIEVTAVVLNERDKPCAEGRARFVPLSADQATSALGATPTGEDAGYVKGG
jgi:uncharacterized protein (TIGR00369 family)